MSYEIFSQSPIGTVKELFIENGLLRFVKSSSTMWLIEYALRNVEPFLYTRFSSVCPSSEASCLYDQYSK